MSNTTKKRAGAKRAKAKKPTVTEAIAALGASIHVALDQLVQRDLALGRIPVLPDTLRGGEQACVASAGFAQQTAPAISGSIGDAIDRLRNIAEKSDELSRRLEARLSPVLTHHSNPVNGAACNAVAPPLRVQGNVASALHEIADRLYEDILRKESLIERAEV